jgi:uncharacterized SAM-binding protein YcdF (DUF218 family)
MTDRELFLVTLAYQRPSNADAIVCLAGEDAENRAFDAAELFKHGNAPGILVTGGRHEPPTIDGAESVASMIRGQGIFHDRILTDPDAKNTYQQAVNTIATAQAKGWKRLILVASTYHQPRAFLTFLRALQEAKAEDIYVAHYPVMGADRFAERLALELEKVDDYAEIGHCASYRDGLDYLARWEGK